MGANLNIGFYEHTYFYFDMPVKYKIADKELIIYPITVKDSEIFLSSVPILNVDKNSIPSVEIIQMSYMEFMYKELFKENVNIDRMALIAKYCLHMESPFVGFDRDKKPYLEDRKLGIKINSKQFEDIRRIILYQNLIHYDDEYINPEIKQMMVEVDNVKNAGIDSPTIERRIAIITAHCGISKKEQLEMTYRSHCLLFEEVYGEVEFTTVRPIMLYAGKGGEIDHWIYKKKKDKFDGYTVDTEKYVSSMGGNKDTIKSTSDTNLGDTLSQQYNEFMNK